MKSNSQQPVAAKITVVALVIAAVSVGIQILSGAEYPKIPPAFFILLVPAALLSFTRWRFAGILAILSGVFLLFGLVGSGAYVRLIKPNSLGDTFGLWLMTVSLVVATVGAITTTRKYYSKQDA